MWIIAAIAAYAGVWLADSLAVDEAAVKVISIGFSVFLGGFGVLLGAFWDDQENYYD
jgi:ABC-type transport system involved in cytochrome c biogenesis permease subunit